MRFNYKKVAAIGASVLLTGMTMGVAAAANFPAPYSSGSSSGTAVVSGTGAGVDDTVATSSIADYLATKVKTTGGVATGGDSYKFEKTSTKFHLGDTFTGVISTSLDEDEMSNLLADGKFVDDDNDEFDYTQKITMEALQLTMFEDNDYKEDEPSVGFKIASGTTVLTYQLTFSDEPLLTDLETSDLTFMGKSYYILTQSYSGANVILTLLDSASETIVSEDETATLTVEGMSYSVSIEYISDTKVKLTINGETTNSLEEKQTQKLSDGAFVGIKDIMYNAKDTGISKVEFSIGNGKLKLTSGSEIQLNDDTVSGLTATIVNTTKLTSIALAWATDDDEFVTEDSDVTMPAFGAVKLSFQGLDYPVEETIEVKQGGSEYIGLENFPLKNGPADINLLYGSAGGPFSGIGKDANNALVTAASGSNITYDKDTDDYFVASWSDSSDAESYLMRATGFTTESSVDKANIQYYDGDTNTWIDKKTGVKDDDTFSIGSVDLKVFTVNNTLNNIIIGNNSANTNFHTLYSKEGMTVYLPYLANDSTADGAVNFSAGVFGNTGHTNVSFYLVAREEDKNGNKYSGDWVNLTLAWDSSTTPEPEVSSINMSNTDATSTEILDTDVWRDFTYSALATEILYTKPSSGQKSVKLVYHGDEVAANVYISSSETSFGTVTAGSMVFKDNEKSSWQSRNVVLVGGSCINSATADALGVTYPVCGADFTSATGVGSGEYMIKSVGDAFTTGKIALVVAGYEKADTAAAASKLVNNPGDVDTTAGKEYRGKTGVTGSLAFAEV